MDLTTRLGMACAAGITLMLTAATAAALGPSAGSVTAQQPANIAVAPSTAAPGQTITISGGVPVSGDRACAPGSAIVTSTADLFPPDGFGPEVPRGNTGAFEITYTIPAGTPAGTYQVGLRCGGGNVGVSASLVVSPGPPSTTESATTTTMEPSTTSSSDSPTTTTPPDDGDDGGGDSPAPWIALGVLGLLLVGATAYALGRRRTSRGSSSL